VRRQREEKGGENSRGKVGNGREEKAGEGKEARRGVVAEPHQS